jgi:RimJ/RimL family protein N-acetyltransferase
MFPELAHDDVFRLETRRLWLRWPQAADAPALGELAGDWDVARMTANLPHPYRREDADHFIGRSREDNARGAALLFALTLKSLARQTIGVIGIEPSDFGPKLGYWLGRPYWGRGLASEAAAAVVDAFFLVTPRDELGATVLEENAASRGVLENLGFVEAAREAESASLRLALRRRDWRARGGGLQPGCGSVTALT